MNDATDIDNLLDATLDDLEDLPSFQPFPAGVHKVLASLNMADINGNQAVELSLKGMETLELVDAANTVAIKEGDSSNTIFMLNNEYGRGNLKKVCAPIGVALGTGVIREVIEQCKDLECVVITSIRTDKNDPDKKYLNIKELQVV